MSFLGMRRLSTTRCFIPFPKLILFLDINLLQVKTISKMSHCLIVADAFKSASFVDCLALNSDSLSYTTWGADGCSWQRNLKLSTSIVIKCNDIHHHSPASLSQQLVAIHSITSHHYFTIMSVAAFLFSWNWRFARSVSLQLQKLLPSCWFVFVRLLCTSKEITRCWAVC